MQRIKIPLGGECRSARDLGGSPRSTPTTSRTSPHRVGRSLPFHIDDTPHPHASARRVGHTTREACGTPRSQRHRLADRRLPRPRRSTRRRTPTRSRSSCWATTTRRTFASVQGCVLGLRRQPVRSDQLPQRRLHRAHTWSTAKRSAAWLGLRGRRPRHMSPKTRSSSTPSSRGRAAADPDPGGGRTCSLASARRRTAQRAAQVPDREAGPGRVQTPRARGARRVRPIRAGRRACPTCTSPTRSRYVRGRAAPAGPRAAGFNRWRASNVVEQRRAGLRDGDNHPAARWT